MEKLAEWLKYAAKLPLYGVLIFGTFALAVVMVKVIWRFLCWAMTNI